MGKRGETSERGLAFLLAQERGQEFFRNAAPLYYTDYWEIVKLFPAILFLVILSNENLTGLDFLI